MIKIRYRDPNELSPGLHAAAECHGRGTTVYLLCGLTAAQRRSALRRLRLTARMGHCPPLPAAQLALALGADRIGTGVGRARAVFRSHPAGSTVPLMLVSAGAIVFLMLSASIRGLPPPRVAGQPRPAAVTVPAISGARTGVGSIDVTVATTGACRAGPPGRWSVPAFPGPLAGLAARASRGSARICGCPVVPLR